MAFQPYTVDGSEVDGLSHVNAIQILLTQLIEHVNTFNADETVLAQIKLMTGEVETVSTQQAFSALNPTPILQSVNENQLTGQLAVNLSLPVTNSYASGAVLTESRLVYGEDDGL